MTWREFKARVEAQGVDDDMTVVSISFIGNAVEEHLGVITDANGFSVFGRRSDADETETIY